MQFSPSELDNFSRFNQNVPFFESWYVLLDLLEANHTLWINYHVVYSENQSAEAKLTAHIFELETPQIYTWKERFGFDFFRQSSKFFFVQIGKSWLKQNSAYGEIHCPALGKIKWDLEFEPNLESSPILPPLLEASPWPHLKRNTPQPLLKIYGQIAYQNRRLILEEEPAMQGHYWACAWPQKILWVFCNTFLEFDQAFFELSSLTHIQGRLTLPRLNSAVLKINKDIYHFTHYRALFKNQLQPTESGWTFYLDNGKFCLQGKIELPKPNQIIAGAISQTKIADCTLNLFEKITRKWEKRLSLSAGQTCAVAWTKNLESGREAHLNL